MYNSYNFLNSNFLKMVLLAAMSRAFDKYGADAGDNTVDADMVPDLDDDSQVTAARAGLRNRVRPAVTRVVPTRAAMDVDRSVPATQNVSKATTRAMVGGAAAMPETDFDLQDGASKWDLLKSRVFVEADSWLGLDNSLSGMIKRWKDYGFPFGQDSWDNHKEDDQTHFDVFLDNFSTLLRDNGFGLQGDSRYEVLKILKRVPELNEKYSELKRKVRENYVEQVKKSIKSKFKEAIESDVVKYFNDTVVSQLTEPFGDGISFKTVKKYFKDKFEDSYPIYNQKIPWSGGQEARQLFDAGEYMDFRGNDWKSMLDGMEVQVGNGVTFKIVFDGGSFKPVEIE